MSMHGAHRALVMGDVKLLRMSSPPVLPQRDATDLASREAWVDMQLASTFMRYALASLHSSVLVTAVIVALLYGSVDPLALGIWTVAAVAITLLRYAVIFAFRRKLDGVSGPPLYAFLARWGWAWPATGVIWGASMFVFFLKASTYDQFVCITVLVAMPTFAIGTFSTWLRAFNGYVDGLCLTVVAALVWQLLMGQAIPANFTTAGMFALALIYWLAIRMSGRRFYDVQRANVELQFDNHALVSSLTAKTRSALDAVAVKNRFIASAAHDLRQPVHALSLYASWLVAEPELVEQIAPKISRSTRAVNDMFDSLFDFAGLENAVLQPNFQIVDLTTLLQDLELQYAPVALERQLQLRTRTVAGLKVRSDPLLLKRLVGNLLSNALKNTVTGGVLLAVRRRRNAVHIEVWDTGVGVAREHQHAIFQEFYRIPQPGTDEGFGLGLAIVSALSRALGHPVGMLSRVGHGSVFWVQLPLLKAGEVANRSPVADPVVF
jgi:signal transduction histidine kinase